MTHELISWLTKFRWSAVWALAPSFPHPSALTALSTGKRIITLWEERTGEALGALLLVEPHPGTRIYHLHGLISAADDFNPDGFREFSSKWGQTEVKPYRPGGGYCRYVAKKLLRPDVEWDLYGKIILKEGENVDYN